MSGNASAKYYLASVCFTLKQRENIFLTYWCRVETLTKAKPWFWFWLLLCLLLSWPSFQRSCAYKENHFPQLSGEIYTGDHDGLRMYSAALSATITVFPSRHELHTVVVFGSDRIQEWGALANTANPLWIMNGQVDSAALSLLEWSHSVVGCTFWNLLIHQQK